MAWEKRWHPLLEEWVTITSHRNQRPWSGSTAEHQATAVAYDTDCYLCPGNARVSGVANPDYASVFVFDNDHPAFTLDSIAPEPTVPFFQQSPVTGVCRVLCYAPQHNRTLAELKPSQLLEVVNQWRSQTASLFAESEVENVFIFENKGEIVGVSNPHPHCQIYATDFVPVTIQRELEASRRYKSECGRDLFADLIEAEEEDGRRIVFANETAVAFVPYFARFPYETYVSPKMPVARIDEMSDLQTEEFSAALGSVLVKYDNLWNMSFPYILTLHQAPRGVSADEYRFHIQIHPPLRAPGLQKFLAGIETGAGNFLNDGCPEDKAAELTAASPVHYKAGPSA